MLQQTTLEYTWGFEGKGGIFANFSSIVLIDTILRRHKGESYYTQEDIGGQGRGHRGAGQQDRAQGGEEEGVDHLNLALTILTSDSSEGVRLPACLLSMEDKQHCVHCLCCHNQKPSLVNVQYL